MKNTNYIYVIINMCNYKAYVGQHGWAGVGMDPNYFGSSDILCEDIKKYGKYNFKKYIIEYINYDMLLEFDNKLNLRETFWINELDTLAPNGYNKNRINVYAKSNKPIDVIFSKTERRILCLLFTPTFPSLYFNEIVQLCNMGKGCIQRVLKNMVDCFILKKETIGNRRYYSVNKNSLLFTPIDTMLKLMFHVPKQIKHTFNLTDNITNAFIFNNIQNNDVNLCIIGNDLTYTNIIKSLLPIEQQNNCKICITIYTPTQFDKLLNDNNFFVKSIIKNVTTIVKG